MTRLVAVCSAVAAAVGALLVLAPAAAAAPGPDLHVAVAAGQARSVTAGGYGVLQFAVLGAAPDATVTVDVGSPGEVVDVLASDGGPGVPYPCSTTATSTVCDLGALTGTTSIAVNLRVAPTAVIGSRLHVSADVEPVPGPDADPADNTVSADFTVFALADITATLTPDRPTTVAPGATTSFRATLTNAGTHPVTGETATFSLTGSTAAGVASGDVVTFGRFTSTSVTVAPASPTNRETSTATWAIGTLAPGASVSLDVPVTAGASSGRGVLSWRQESDGNPSDGRAGVPSGIALTVAAPASPPAVPILAATGSTTRPLTLLGALLLLVGSGLVAVGRRRAAHRG